MLDSSKRAEMDQSREELAELVPALIRSVYEGYKKEFPEHQAWELAKITCFAMSGGKGTM